MQKLTISSSFDSSKFRFLLKFPCLVISKFLFTVWIPQNGRDIKRKQAQPTDPHIDLLRAIKHNFVAPVTSKCAHVNLHKCA